MRDLSIVMCGHTDCDDPAGISDLVASAYIYPSDPDTSDDDTDGDGCTDDEELGGGVRKGALRDPWNPHDFSR